MMHTIMPMEVVFPEQATTPILQEIRHGGVNLLVEQLPNGKNRIQRIISSNPADYLNPNLQPGIML